MDFSTGLRSQRRNLWKVFLPFTAGLLLLAWLFNTPAGLLGKADAVGYAVCHRIDLRSFHLGDRQVPLCVRCSGMYLGFMLGLIFQARLGPRRSGLPPRRVMAALGVLLLAFGVDGVNSFLSLLPGVPLLYQPHNTLRLLTGTGMGIVVAAALFPVFNLTVWKDWRPRPTLGDLRTLGGLLALGLLLDLLILSKNPLILYPLAILSALSVLGLLTGIYTMVWIMLFHRENRFDRWVALLLPLSAGFATALLQIGLIDAVRYLLTGTWEGFHL